MIAAPMITDAQRSQIEKQMELHMRCSSPSVLPPISLDADMKLDGMVVNPGVLWPMSSKRLAAFIWRNQSMVRGKTVVDMGSGCGLQGIVAGLCGASDAVLTDVTREAYQNSKENVSRYDLESTCSVRCGDLFQHIQEPVDVIIFAQPYFPGTPDPRYPFTYGMLDNGELIHRFLEQARTLFKDRILMCWLDIAGDVNNPGRQAPKHGYIVKEHGPEALTTGEQQGEFWVHELTL